MPAQHLTQTQSAPLDEHQKAYLRLLARQYPNVQAAASEIINLCAILNLPKGTEHFMSDLHGEYEAFEHILNNASGAVKEKVDLMFGNSLSKQERAQLATLIYYPVEKLAELTGTPEERAEWYRLNLYRLIDLCRMCASKYTRSKVRKALPKDYAYILEELLNTNYEVTNRREYYDNIIETITSIGCAEDFIKALCTLIKRLVVDHLHIVGDIFDRGPRADIIMDLLMQHHSVDIQWGNHDVLWMGAATGSRTCIAVVLNNSICYSNLEVIENGYGISLRPLAVFADEVYARSDTSCFAAKILGDDPPSEKDQQATARMHKAISVIQFKLEGQIIRRNPAFGMDDRLLLEKVDYQNGTITLDGKTYPLRDTDFPTIDPADPYALSEDETNVMLQLRKSFMRSEKLQKHVKFLYSKGALYCCYNGNLLFHGCIPMDENGDFLSFAIDGKSYSGKAYIDQAEAIARQGYYAAEDTPEKQFGRDFLWFLWCGRNSPLFGRDHMATIERCLIADQATWAEPQNAYYRLYQSTATCDKILAEFGLHGPHCHIVNGHVPVRTKNGESPLKAGGKLIVIDGGFCRAYQKTTGIAGYTLIYNSWGIRLAAHEPFTGIADAIANNRDIASSVVVFDRMENRIRIKETDAGREIARSIAELKQLLAAFKSGLIAEQHSGN